MEDAIVASTFGPKFLATLTGICGGITLVLSFVWIYSMVSHAVSQRIHEFGVWMALGAALGRAPHAHGRARVCSQLVSMQRDEDAIPCRTGPLRYPAGPQGELWILK